MRSLASLQAEAAYLRKVLNPLERHKAQVLAVLQKPHTADELWRALPHFTLADRRATMDALHAEDRLNWLSGGYDVIRVVDRSTGIIRKNWRITEHRGENNRKIG